MFIENIFCYFMIVFFQSSSSNLAISYIFSKRRTADFFFDKIDEVSYTLYVAGVPALQRKIDDKPTFRFAVEGGFCYE